MFWVLLNCWPKLLVFWLDPYKSSSKVGLGTFKHSSSPFPFSNNFFVTNAFLDTCCFYCIILREGLDMHELVFFSWNGSLAWFVSPILKVPMHVDVGSIDGFMEDRAQMHKMQNCSIRYIPINKWYLKYVYCKNNVNKIDLEYIKYKNNEIKPYFKYSKYENNMKSTL